MANIGKEMQDSVHDEQRANFYKSLPSVLGKSYVKQIIPKKGWKINEDYVNILDNGTVSTVALVFAKPGKATELLPQWGVEFISKLVDDVKSVNKGDVNAINISFVNTVRVMSSEWVKENQTNADRYYDPDQAGDSTRDRVQAQTRTQDMQVIAYEIDKGASYLAVGFKYIISAIDVKHLDDFLEKLQKRLEMNIPGIEIALSNGDIDYEYQRIFDDPMKEPGNKLMFTSQEFAGFYNLVTHGIEDSTGVYMGEQVGDINNTAVIWDMTKFTDRAVMAIDNRFYRYRDYLRGYIPEQFQALNGSDLWLNTLILQLVREKQGHVFTLALDPMNLVERLKSTTSVVNLNKGTINPFELFGDPADELDIYQANIEKWSIITRQLASFDIQSKNAYHEEAISTIELDDLGTVLEQFYIDNKLWVKNAANNRDKLRLVGIDHKDVPTLSEFVSYLGTEYRKYNNPVTGDKTKANELNKLHSIYRNLLSNNGDLFDTITDPIVDVLGNARHTLIDYSHLTKRKGNILLIQLLNSISAIANQAHDGDVLIIHGAQRITSMTESYINEILSDLKVRHVRVVFSYNTADAMFKSVDFNKMSSADWTLTGHLTADEVAKYNELLDNQRQITDVIQTGIQAKNEARYYLRRGQDNVLFDANQVI